MSQKKCVYEKCRGSVCGPTICEGHTCRKCGSYLEYRIDWLGWECKKCKEHQKQEAESKNKPPPTILGGFI